MDRSSPKKAKIMMKNKMNFVVLEDDTVMVVVKTLKSNEGDSSKTSSARSES